ncbi:MAG: glycosyltransferase family 4 protein, partial [Candidatus Aminicenantes bacterium]|nr:glycosyltransferase family 4 protein [Candidatus Aminicenantes bacterium]
MPDQPSPSKSGFRPRNCRLPHLSNQKGIFPGDGRLASGAFSGRQTTGLRRLRRILRRGGVFPARRLFPARRRRIRVAVGRCGPLRVRGEAPPRRVRFRRLPAPRSGARMGLGGKAVFAPQKMGRTPPPPSFAPRRSPARTGRHALYSVHVPARLGLRGRPLFRAARPALPPAPRRAIPSPGAARQAPPPPLRKMKIVHAVHNYHPARGGAENLMKGVSDRLARRGHEVRVVATNAYSTEDYFLPGRGKKKSLMAAGTEKIDGVTVTRVPFRRFGAPLLNAARATANRLPVSVPVPGRDFWRMISWGPRGPAYRRAVGAAGRGADLIVACPLPTLNVWYARRAARSLGLPFVVVPCFHTEDRLTFHNERYFRWLREADAVVCLTDWEREYLGAAAGVPADRLHTIGVGVDIGSLPEENEAASRDSVRGGLALGGDGDGDGDGNGDEVVLFLGQHSRHKGILALISAMHLIWKRGRKAGLVIAGNPTAF